MRPKKKKSIFSQISSLPILLIFAAVTFLPLWYLLLLSLATYKDTFEFLLFPKKFIWQNYIEAWQTAKISVYYKNSIMVSLAALALNTAVGIFAAYAFARFRFYLKEVIFYTFVATMMLPGVAILIPLYLNLKKLGLLNTYAALIFSYTAIGLPLTIFILRGFFETIPGNLDDAAKIDGASELRIVFSIVLPLSKPALATVAILQFALYWNELVFAFTFITDDAKKTLPAGLLVLQGEYWTNWPVFAAALMISIIPVVVVYLAMQKYFQKGLTLGAFKE